MLLGVGHAVRPGGAARPGRGEPRRPGRGRARKEEARLNAPRPSRPRWRNSKRRTPRHTPSPRSQTTRRARAPRRVGRTPRARPRRRMRSMAKTSQKVRQGRKAPVSEPRIQPLPSLWTPARLLPQVRPLPDLPARGRARGLRPRHDQVELVEQMHTDPIADYLTRIRNAIRAGHDEVDIPASTAEGGDVADPQGAGLHHRLPQAPPPVGERSRSTSNTPRTAARHPRDRTGLPSRPPPLR